MLKKIKESFEDYIKNFNGSMSIASFLWFIGMIASFSFSQRFDDDGKELLAMLFALAAIGCLDAIIAIGYKRGYRKGSDDAIKKLEQK